VGDARLKSRRGVWVLIWEVGVGQVKVFLGGWKFPGWITGGREREERERKRFRVKGWWTGRTLSARVVLCCGFISPLLFYLL